MENIIVTVTLLLIFGLAISKIIVEKRKGSKCVGCSQAGGCSPHKKSTNKMLDTKIQIKKIKKIS